MPLIIYTNSRGFKEVREVPANAQQRDYHKGIFIGPPDLSELGWETNKLRELNNALVDAGLIDYHDLRGHRDLLTTILSKITRSKSEVRDIRKIILIIYQRQYYPEIFGG